MSSIINDLAERMAEGQVNGKSEFKVRDDKARSKARVRKLSRIELALGKASKILVFAEVAFPFNPATGAPDDEYNEESKFRPMFSVHTVCSSMKALADKNPAVKEAILAGSGISEWDTSGELNMEADFSVFRRFRSPRYFTMNIVRVNDQRVTGRDFAAEYRLEGVKYNSLGEIEGETPLILKINKLYRDLRQLEVADVTKKRNMEREGKTHTLVYERPELQGVDLAGKKDDDFSTILSAIRRDVPVSDDNPSNSVVGDEFVLDSEMKMVEVNKIASYSLDDMERSLRLIKCSAGFQKGLNLFTTGSLKNKDRYWDFYELEMECPVEIEKPSNNQKRDLGQQTEYNKPAEYLKDYAESHPGVEDKLIEMVRKQLDSDEFFERRYMISSYAKPITQELEAMLLDLIVQDEILQHPYMSKQVLQYNSEVLSKAYGDEFQKVLAKLDIGIIPNGMLDQDYDQTEAARASKEASVEALLEGTGDEFAVPGEAQDEEDAVEDSGAMDGADTVPVASDSTEIVDDGAELELE